MIETFDAFIKKQFDSNTTNVEKTRSIDEIKKLYPQMAEKYFKDTMYGRSYTKDKASSFLADMKKRRANVALNPAGAKIDPVTKKPVINVGTKTAPKPDTKSTPISLPANAPTLTDSQAQTKLQAKMVQLLGASATILQYILVKESPDIQIDKMTLSKKLLKTAQTQLAIAGLPK